MASLARFPAFPPSVPLRLWAGLADTPFGCSQIVWGAPGIASLVWPDRPVTRPSSEFSPVLALDSGWLRDDCEAARLAGEIFSGHHHENTFRAWVRGSDFQWKVWSALTRIPFGTTTTYSTIASEMGHPGAARAVGTAIAANTVAFLIPCHRVLPACRPPGNFRWGTARKTALLEWERQHRFGPLRSSPPGEPRIS